VDRGEAPGRRGSKASQDQSGLYAIDVYAMGASHADTHAFQQHERERPMTQADSLIRGLEEALAFRRGETTLSAVRQVEAPAEVDVAAIRARTGLSQGAFARSIGVPRATLLNWEHGRRRVTELLG